MVMDEFAATLDRDTAKIVAFNVQRLARQACARMLWAEAILNLNRLACMHACSNTSTGDRLSF